MAKSILKVAVVQLSSSVDPSANFVRIRKLLGKCLAEGCDLAVLPENCLCHGDNCSIARTSKSLSDWTRNINDNAGKYDFPVVWGGIPVLSAGRRYNSSLVILKGDLMAFYRKNHLFSYKSESGDEVDEAELYSPGNTAVKFQFKGWSIGLSICFDLRFPEFFRKYDFPDIIVSSSAFTYKTGKAHWEILLKARAVDNQCYVLAANQHAGKAKDFPATYGHSIIADPWGEIIKTLPKGEGLVLAELKKEAILSVKSCIRLK